jgi:hypothetical protein
LLKQRFKASPGARRRQAGNSFARRIGRSLIFNLDRQKYAAGKIPEVEKPCGKIAA